jgi:hypothetical protein
MQLRLTAWSGNPTELDGEMEFTVKSEPDILKAGFFAAREVRKWLRAMPFVPSRSNLEFTFTAEVESGEATPASAAGGETAPKRKKRKKASD